MGFCKHSIFAVIILLYSHISHNLHDDSVEFSTISLKLLQWNWVVTKFRLPMVTLPNKMCAFLAENWDDLFIL